MSTKKSNNKIKHDDPQLEINVCPGTLAPDNKTYSRTCLSRVFDGRKVDHILPYESPASNEDNSLFLENRTHISISGVQEKFSVILEKNKLRLTREGEQGTYILKPIPNALTNADQLPANEHLTMQIARQVFNIETAENALIFFKNGESAYITKRFDIKTGGGKWAKEDLAALAGRTVQTHGEHYKYLGSYLECFEVMKKYVPAYFLEAPKLFKLLIFNYLFSNGDAHLKNFSLLETPLGDHRLSPAYDLLNTRIHINDKDFALDDGLLPKKLSKGKLMVQFRTLASQAGLNEKIVNDTFKEMLSGSDKIIELINRSFLKDQLKRNYLQAYQARLKQLKKV